MRFFFRGLAGLHDSLRHTMLAVWVKPLKLFVSSVTRCFLQSREVGFSFFSHATLDVFLLVLSRICRVP